MKQNKPVDYTIDHVKHALLMCTLCHQLILWPSDWFDNEPKSGKNQITKYCTGCVHLSTFIKIKRSQIR